MKDRKVIVGCKPYSFKKNQRLECSSWSHIFNAFQYCLDVYEEILCSNQVRKIQRIEPKKLKNKSTY